jgi:hypothetical protein
MTSVNNPLESKIDSRLQQLINDTYSRSDGGYDRQRYQKLLADRMSGRRDPEERLAFQNSEYFDEDDAVFKEIMKSESYAGDAHSFKKNIEKLKRMNADRDNDLDNIRTDIKSYLDTGYNTEPSATAAGGTIEALTSVPELFVKERNIDGNGYTLVNVADLVNHIHYKIMVERKIPENNDKKQYSYQNISNINKAARERLAPFVKAFLATYEMTPEAVRRVYASKDNNLVSGSQGLAKPGSASQGAVANLANKIDPLQLAAMSQGLHGLHGLPSLGGGSKSTQDALYNILQKSQKGGKKKSKKSKKSKKGKKSKKSKKGRK